MDAQLPVRVGDVFLQRSLRDKKRLADLRCCIPTLKALYYLLLTFGQTFFRKKRRQIFLLLLFLICCGGSLHSSAHPESQMVFQKVKDFHVPFTEISAAFLPCKGQCADLLAVKHESHHKNVVNMIGLGKLLIVLAFFPLILGIVKI